MAWRWCGVFFCLLGFFGVFFVCFFEKHAVRREKLCCINSPFPHSFLFSTLAVGMEAVGEE